MASKGTSNSLQGFPEEEIMTNQAGSSQTGITSDVRYRLIDKQKAMKHQCKV